MHALGSTSVAALWRYLDYAEAQQLDTQAALAAAQINSEQLKDSNSRVSLQAFEELLSHLLAQRPQPLFGLNAARHVQPASWHVLGYITMNCATLGDALDRIIPFEKLVSDSGTTQLQARGSAIELTWHCQHQAPLLRQHLSENVLAAWLLYAQWLVDDASAPLKVSFAHPQPSGTTVEDYQALFACPVAFNQAHNALLIPASYLQLPVRQADAMLLHTLEQHASSLLNQLQAPAQLPVTVQVSQAIAEILASRVPRQEDVAQHCALSLRTLQRRLQEAGSSYQQLLDEVRFAQAKTQLTGTQKPLHSIAEQLGFIEPRSFFRFFKRRAGVTPGQYRKQHKA